MKYTVPDGSLLILRTAPSTIDAFCDSQATHQWKHKDLSNIHHQISNFTKRKSTYFFVFVTNLKR